MADRTKARDLKLLLAEAVRLGATSARLLPSKDIVVDERVRLKCLAPRCENYERHLLCPPNLISVQEFRRIVGSYRKALIVQVESSEDSLDRSSSGLSGRLTKELAKKRPSQDPELRLHKMINELERYAFKHGFYLAAGLIGSDCALCAECVGTGGKPCKHPFEARPSMQSMGINVFETCRKAGLGIQFSSGEKVKWTGILLLE